ncbi:hypothetical protein REPUB_Repub14bG0039100 [Reevesia pubescens]
MDSWNLNLNLTLFSLLLLLLFSFSTSTVTATSSHVTLNPFEDIVCSFINCGEGTCQASNNSLLGFDCQCNPGWKRIQIGLFTFPSCLIPNCTVDFHCGKGSTEAPPPPPPPPPLAPASLPPPANQTNRCDIVWCGDGKCVSNGTGHICLCNQGSENLFNSSALACFKPCYFGADCQGLGLDLPLGHHQPPPPPSSTSSSLYGNGLKSVSNCWGTLCQLTMIVVVAVCLPRF